MVSLLRADLKDAAIDQQPLAIANSSGALSAGFLLHGNWDGRTVRPSGDFVAAIEGSGITQYYPYSELPPTPSGDLSELTPESHREAFWNSVKSLGT